MTCDDLFIAAEMSARAGQMAEYEKKKKLAQQLQDVEEKVLVILGQEKAVQSLTVKELEVLLAWHQAPKVTGAKKADKLVQWQNIVAKGKAPPLFARWTDDDEERMQSLAAGGVSIGDTHYGREASLKERELEAAVYTMSREKRDELRRTLVELEAEAEAAVSTSGETGAV